VESPKEEQIVKPLPIGHSSKPKERLAEPAAGGRGEILGEVHFQRMIAVERKRTERSRNPFLLMLIEAGHHPGSEKNGRVLDSVATALRPVIRETDVLGWYRDRIAVGVMYTGLVHKDKNLVLGSILNKVSARLCDELMLDQFNQINISFHFFPDDWDHENPGSPINLALYPDLINPAKGKQVASVMKRVVDVFGSLAMLALTAPLWFLIAIAVKLSSKGPVLFKQQRVGQDGKQFIFLKFRSMQIDNDYRVHQEFISRFIANEGTHQDSNSKGEKLYKLAKDPRVTRVGKFLRRTSLDELPQFLNVLKGDMSLIGPRPPIPYEVAVYQTWHRRRVLRVKPGITGLWQVTGRSRVKFDEMVRLDLRYAMSWTPWLDFKILIRTPLAVIKGTGAM
jgi:lipopolysaccharide/colanic/teichoic acid biosynthesis glycosyltransferase